MRKLLKSVYYRNSSHYHAEIVTLVRPSSIARTPVQRPTWFLLFERLPAGAIGALTKHITIPEHSELVAGASNHKNKLGWCCGGDKEESAATRSPDCLVHSPQ
jgi:hypothetical protein